jgi:hypothetical protein
MIFLLDGHESCQALTNPLKPGMSIVECLTRTASLLYCIGIVWSAQFGGRLLLVKRGAKFHRISAPNCWSSLMFSEALRGHCWATSLSSWGDVQAFRTSRAQVRRTLRFRLRRHMMRFCQFSERSLRVSLEQPETNAAWRVVVWFCFGASQISEGSKLH